VYLVSCNHPGWFRVRAALGRLPDVQIVGESATPDDAFFEVTRLQPDIVLLSGGCSAVDRSPLAERIAAACPQSRLVLVAEQFEMGWLKRFAGVAVHGYLEWSDLGPVALQRCLDLADAGLVACSLSVSVRLLTSAAAPAAPLPTAVLSPRERAVLAGLRAGQSQEGVARDKGMSVATVKRVIDGLKERFGAESLYQLAVIATELRLH
jgi:DNA-binding NarL/FixJ family response regulator